MNDVKAGNYFSRKMFSEGMVHANGKKMKLSSFKMSAGERCWELATEDCSPMNSVYNKVSVLQHKHERRLKFKMSD